MFNNPRNLVLIGLFAALTAVGAFIKIPIQPVAFTLQPLIVMLTGAVLAPRLAVSAQIVYLVMGLIGLPVFANGGGPAYVLNPTFGFLIGFIVAAGVTSTVLHRAHTPGFVRYLIGLGLGLACIYLCGVAGLYINLSLVHGKGEVFDKVVGGLVPYLGFDLIKLGIVAVAARPVRVMIVSLSYSGAGQPS